MNNKLFARIAAAAIGATMLSTAAFAADATINKSGTLNFTGTAVASGQDYVTMMAYTLAEKPADGAAIPDYDDKANEMIALEQVAAATGLSSVSFDSTKLGTAKAVAVKVGGGDSLALDVALPLAADPTAFTKYFVNSDANATVTVEDTVTIDETEYTGAKVVKCEYTADSATEEKITEIGVVFANNEAQASATKQFTEKKTGIEIAAGGKVNFGVAVLGIPEGVRDKIWTFPYVTGTHVED